MAEMLTNTVLVGAPERSDDPTVVGYAKRWPTTATAPTNTTAPYPSEAEDIGYVSEDGLSIETDRSVEYINDWNLDRVRAMLTEHSAVVKFQLIGWTVESLRAFFGTENVDDSGAEIVVRVNSAQVEASGWGFNMLDNGVKRRVIIPNGVVTTQGELVFKKGEQTNLEIELECLSDNAGEKIYIYTAGSAASNPEG